MTITPYAIFDQTPEENLETVERGLYALMDLLEGQTVDDFDMTTRHNLSELIKPFADLTQSARLQIQYAQKHP